MQRAGLTLRQQFLQADLHNGLPRNWRARKLHGFPRNQVFVQDLSRFSPVITSESGGVTAVAAAVQPELFAIDHAEFCKVCEAMLSSMCF